MNTKLASLCAGVVVLAGCVIHTTTGPVQYESRAIERDAADLVRVNLRMGAGDLKVGSGTGKLLQAYFTYNVPAWKPEVRYTAGKLMVDQPGEHHSHAGNMRNEWDLRFGRETGLDLNVNFGAGEAQLDLGTLDLRGVNVQMGVGRMEMDLRGNPKHDYDVRIHGGIGEAVVRLPADAGVYATAHGGIGEIKARGLTKDGDHWVNDAFDHAKVKIRVDVQGGIGAITLIGDTE